MASVVGKVVSVDGIFFAKAADGSLRELSRGDVIYQGETVIGDKSNGPVDSIIVSAQSGEDVIILGEESQLFDSSLVDVAFAEDETVSDIESVEAMFNEDIVANAEELHVEDIDNLETAAGANESETELHSEFAEVEVAEAKKATLLDAETKEMDLSSARASFYGDENELNTTIVDPAVLQESIAAVNEAALIAQEAAQAANEAAVAALENPTAESLSTSQLQQELTIEAAQAANEAADTLNEAINNLLEIAAQSNQTIDVSEALSAVENAQDLATIAFEAANESENITSTIISNLQAAADEAAQAANDALIAAREAQEALGENPTEQAISDAQEAAAAAESALVAAQEALTLYQSAAQATDTPLQNIEAFSASDEVASIVSSINESVAAEIDSDAAVESLYTSAQDAAEAANAAVAAANEATETLSENENPTSADIAQAQNAINAADASIASAQAAQAAYEAAASAAGEELLETPTLSSTSDAQESLTSTVAAEIDSDAAIETLYSSAQEAAEAANAAVAAANEATETLASNENPTSADIAQAQNAINAADASIASAQAAQAAYEAAASAAGEELLESPTLSSTSDAQESLTSTVAAEIDSDAAVETLYTSAQDSAEAANAAVAAAQEALDNLGEAPSLEALSTLSELSDAATAALADSATATAAYEAAATEAGEEILEVTSLSSTDELQDAIDTVLAQEAPQANDDGTQSGAGTLLVSEDFENGAEGWSNNTVTQTDGSATDFLGQFGGTNGEEGVSKTFDFGVEHAGETVVIDFDMYEIDSWDDEQFKVFVNGEEVASDYMSHFGRTWSREATDEEDGGTAIDNVGSSGASHLDNDEAHHYTLEATVDENGQVSLGFGSTLNDRISDESWGIDNVTITAGEDWTSELTTQEDTSLVIDVNDLIANDTDANDDALSVTSVQDATHGEVTLNENGTITFTPDANYNGEATFTYTISDGHGGEDSATVTLNVDSVNDAISVVTDSDANANQINENVEDGTYTGVTLSATDADGESITYSVPDDVPFSVDENGRVLTQGGIDYEAAQSYTFDVMATSADGTSSTQSVTINVSDIDESVSHLESDLSDASDSGISNSDNITNDSTPTIEGNTEAGASVVITLGDVVVGEGVADENGDYSIITSALEDGSHELLVTARDAAGNETSSTQSVTIDTSTSDISELAITNITDSDGDYSEVTISGTGAESGNTVTLFDENNNEVATAVVGEDGSWSADISNLSGTPVNDNEFFRVTETDSAGNETAQTDSTHYWHGTYSEGIVEDSDDFVMAGSGDDTIVTDTAYNEYDTVSGDDSNNSLVIDGGEGNDTVKMSGEMADYAISTNESGNTIITEAAGDVTELRNVENVEFADGVYNVESGEFSSNDVTAEVPTAQMSIGDAAETLAQVVDTQAMQERGITDNGDGTYSQTTYEETAKLMKTQTIEVGEAQNIRLDEAPKYGTIEIQDESGEWSEMVVGQEYGADLEVRFTPDADTIEATKDIHIGTFGENAGTRSFTEKADLSDWGEVSDDGKSIVFRDGDLTVTTSATGGRNDELTVINNPGQHQGAGLGVDDTSGGISGSEKVVVTLEGEDVNQVSFTLDGLAGLFDKSNGTEVIITAYDANGDVIDTQGGFRESGSFIDTYEFTTNVPVHSFEVGTNGNSGTFVLQNMTLSKTIVDGVEFTAIASDGTELSLTSDINIQEGMQITNVTELIPASDVAMTKEVKVVDSDAMAAKGAMLVDGTWVVENGTELVDAPMKEVVDSYEYPVHISASLTDTDGSETLSVTISGVPEGATLSQGVNNADGTWTIEAADGATSINETLTLSVPAGSEDFALSMSASAIESASGDVATSESVSVDVSIPAVVEEEREQDTAQESEETQVLEAPTLTMSIGDVVTVVSEVEEPTAQRLDDIEDVVNTMAQDGDSTYEYDNMNSSLYTGNRGADVIEVNGNSETIATYGGDDVINVDGNQNKTIDAGEGNNRIDIDGNSQSIYVGNDDDSIRVGGNANKDLDLREGDNVLDISGNSSAVYSGSGNDTIVIDKNANGNIGSGAGDDTIEVGGNASKNIDANEGNDSVHVGGTTNGSVYLGGGDDTLEIDKDASKDISGGSGDDSVTIHGHTNGTVDLGSGNDTLHAGDFVQGRIYAAEGDDRVVLDGQVKNYVMGGSGTDSIELNGYSKADWDANKDNVRSYVKEFENIKFSDGVTIDGSGNLTDGSAFEATQATSSTASYEYPITLTASGSNLSDMTLKDLPLGTTLQDSEGNLLTPNSDGVYALSFDGNGSVNVTLVSNSELSNTELNGVKAEVTAISENGDEISSVANAQIEAMSDTPEEDSSEESSVENEGETYDVSDNNRVDGTDGDDTFEMDANDVADGDDTSIFGFTISGGNLDIDGGDGVDTLLMGGDMNIDMSALDDNISNIETINLDEGSQNITSLHIEDVLDVTDEDNILRIDGDSSDTIEIDVGGEDSEWKLGDFKTDAETGATYQEYIGVDGDDTVTVEVNTEIMIDQN